MLQQVVFIAVDSALLYHVPWEEDPCEAGAGSQGVAPGLPVVATKQSSKVENLPVTTKLCGLFLIFPSGRSCKSQHITLGATY